MASGITPFPTTLAHASIMPCVAAVAAMSTPISLIPAAFHRHAAAAAAANPSGKVLVLASVGISHLSLITCNLALYCHCHCRHCRQPGHFPLTNMVKTAVKGVKF
ncbi:MAG: hypothetical protein J0L63_05800 [Anaerolineae bacterium]|nr:hypothetical protein [Anaerolineae bacterium]